LLETFQSNSAKSFEFLKIRWLLFCLVFFGVPLALVFYEYCQWKIEEHRNLKMDLISQLKDAYRRFRPSEAGTNYLEKLLEEQTRLILDSPKPEKSFLVRTRNLKKRFPGVFEFIFIGPDGTTVASCSDVFLQKDLLKEFWHDMSLQPFGNSESLQKNMTKYQEFLGPLAGRTVRKSLCNRFDSASYRPERRWVFYSTVSPRGMILVFCNQVPRFDEIIFIQRCRDIRIEMPRIEARIINLKAKMPFRKESRNEMEKWLRSAVVQLGETEDKVIALGGFLWIQAKFSPTLRLLMAVRNLPRERVRKAATRFGFFCSIVFLIFSKLAFDLMIGSRKLYLSIRSKLFFLIGFSIGVSLILLGISATGFLREKKLVLESEFHSEQEKIMREMDREFLKISGNLSRFLREFFGRPFTKPDSIFEETCTRVSWVAKTFHPSIVELIDENGKSLFKGKSKMAKSIKAGFNIVQNSAAKILRELNKIPDSGKESAKDQFVSLTAEFFGFNVEAVISAFTENVGEIRKFKIANKFANSILIPIFDEKGYARFSAVLIWADNLLEAIYVRKLIRKFNAKWNGTVFCATSDKHDFNYPSPPPFPNVISRMSRAVDREVLTVKGKFRHRGVNYLAAGMKCRFLTDFNLFALTEDRKINEEIFELGFQRFSIGCLILVVSFSIGGSLAGIFLVPIQNLSQGIQAIRNRKFDFRITLESQDELGDLAATFNGMMEGLKDLEIAAVLQENFFPAKEVVQNGCKIFGTSVSANKVGGDYFDFFPIENENWGIVIGDVSGHGVGAALVVAMAKALISHPANDFEPAKILGMMQRVLALSLKKKKLMSCIFGVLDTRKREIRLSNAGHNFPYHVKAANAEMIEVRGPLLGAKATWQNYETISIPIKEKEAIVFYTDGIIEGLDTSGKMIGYERFQNALPNLLRNTPLETEKAIRDWYKNSAAPGPLADDITILIVQI